MPETSSPWERTAVLVVSHHSRRWAGPLGDALREAPAVVVVDNASADGSPEAFEAALPRALVVRLPANVGFGAAHNLAAREAAARWPGHEFLLVLNPDCRLDADALRVLERRLDEQPQAGAVSPRLVSADGAPQATQRPAFFKARPRARADQPGAVEWLCGACLLVRRTAWEAVGGFDPRYFLFYEDDDLCLRLQRAGWACWFEPQARATHEAGTGSAPSWGVIARKAFHLARSKRLAIATWVGARAAWLYRLRTFAGALLAIPLYLLLLQPRRALIWAARGASVFSSIDRPWVDLPLGRMSGAPGAP